MDDLILHLDLADDTPAYRQIADQLRTLLVKEKLQPGDRLPPVRQLALDLGIHHNTVAQAYRILADEEWLELARGRGAAVRDRSRPRSTRRQEVRFVQALETLVAKALGQGTSHRWVARRLQHLADEILQSEGAR